MKKKVTATEIKIKIAKIDNLDNRSGKTMEVQIPVDLKNAEKSPLYGDIVKNDVKILYIKKGNYKLVVFFFFRGLA